MRVHGVTMVRNGVDTLRLSVLHHLQVGCQHIHVVDNGSTDGTTEVLRRLARKIPLTYSYDDGPYAQHEVVTELAREAARQGAEWVVPFDHDEFWVSEHRHLHELLAAAGDAGAVEAEMVNFAQRREVIRRSPRSLLTCVRRPAHTLDPIAGQDGVEAGTLSFFEYGYPPKLLLRASERVDVQRGAHWSKQLEGPIIAGDGLCVLHAPLAARDVLARKASQGVRLRAAGYVEREGWHERRWADIAAAGGLDADWATVSVDADGCVDIAGEQRPFVADTRLRDTAAPWVRSPLAQVVARALRRSY